VLALLALSPWRFSSSGLIIGLVGTHVFGTLGINLGYHRLLAHGSLKVPRWLERSFVTIALCCLEDTPARWVATHRLHHVHSDEEEDPHTPRDGVFWSHVGWLFRPAAARGRLRARNQVTRGRRRTSGTRGVGSPGRHPRASRLFGHGLLVS
jgi:stearoyl-CoA desaturase (delta-9 desaturase)